MFPPRAESADTFAARLATQQQERETALSDLARLRKEARAEIDRLIAFLDASDPYACTELEPSLGWPGNLEVSSDIGGADDREGPDDDLEYSLGFLERHPSVYGSGRDLSGNQDAICAGLREDLENEHDGREPGEDAEPSLGSFDRMTNQEKSWRQTFWLAAFSPDVEADDCDREDDDPAEESESAAIGDLAGLLEQVGSQDSTHTVMG